MVDLIGIGGPVGTCPADKVQWQRDTKIISVSAGTAKNTSTDQAAKYAALAARDGLAWKQMCDQAGISYDQLGNLGIAGFSAFHGFANAFLQNQADYDACSYVHLMDACFEGAGATTPFSGYAKFATEAAAGGNKLMVATTNGPFGKDISYSYTYPDGTTSNFNLTSGAKCFELVWNAATQGGIAVSTPDAPPGVPAPTQAMRAGNLLWFHYETEPSGLTMTCPGDNSSHAWHANFLATPYMQLYGAPWMNGIRSATTVSAFFAQSSMKKSLVIGAAALIAFLVLSRVLKTR